MDDWDKHVLQVIDAYNSIEHSSTGISPYMMLADFEKAFPLTLFCPEYDSKKTARKHTYVM